LGLSGVYNQVLLDGFPLIKGLSYTYGISSIPGTLVDNIFIAKGANSNSFMEKHANINYAFKQGDWHSLATFSTVQPAKKVDGDKDTFLDVPLLTRYSISNKWAYGNSTEWGWHSQINVRLLQEERIGGTQPEISVKTGFRWDDIHNLTMFASAFHQNQNAYFGLTKYDAIQTYFYGNIQYEHTYKEKHIVKTGLSYRYSNVEEDLSFSTDLLARTFAGKYDFKEKTPGIFVENTLYLFQDKLTWMAGIRGDHHNQFGFHLTPRTLLKYSFSPATVVRANIGADDLAPEKALNYGINFTHKFEGATTIGVLSLDYYRTDFQNQIFPDYDSDPQKVLLQRTI